MVYKKLQELKEQRPEEDGFEVHKDLLFEYVDWLDFENDYALQTKKNYILAITNLLKKNKTIDSKVLQNFISRNKNKRMKIAVINNFRSFLLDKYGLVLKDFRIPRVETKKALIRPLDPSDVDKLIPLMPEEYQLLTRVLYIGALRVSEGFALRLHNFDWIKWQKDTKEMLELTIDDSKRGKSRIVFLPETLAREIAAYINTKELYYQTQDLTKNEEAPVLFDLGSPNFKKYMRRKMRHIRKGKFFPEDVKTGERDRIIRDIAFYRYLRKSAEYFANFIKKAGQMAFERNDIKSHLLRHSRICHLEESGVSLPVIRDYVGHTSLSTTNQYIHTNPDKIKKALMKIKESSEDVSEKVQDGVEK